MIVGQKHDETFQPATSIFICDSQLNPPELEDLGIP